MARKNIDIELVKSEGSYRRALKQLAAFFDRPPKQGSAE